MRIAVLNGPNLNLLGVREPELYGSESLEDIEASVRAKAELRGVEVLWYQTNHEGEFVDLVQGLRGKGQVGGALVNAAGFTHTSIAIRDALLAVQVPFVEVHLSNIFAREPERRVSVLADIAVGIVAGFGGQSYLLAFDALIDHVTSGDR
ncbi:MAG: 3-dehydroquinate dehydratase [Gemmatimonadetes bacterium]|nr:3-dehydroquinate dehydratase [Gemmatimonadota bacterium]